MSVSLPKNHLPITSICLVLIACLLPGGTTDSYASESDDSDSQSTVTRVTQSRECLPGQPVIESNGSRCSSPPLRQAGIPAFPGAQGFGSTTPGGRGGRVLQVTRLDDDEQEGSLRWAINQSGPRTVVFKTGGLIRLKKKLVIRNPFITIAGQTAPGSGITLTGGYQFAIRTHDVIMRGIRSRPGDGVGAPGSQRDALSIGRARNVVIDHCSFSWATDENISIWFAARDITLSWNIIAQGLGNSLHEKGLHSMGMIVGDNSHRISIHNNLFAANHDRNPYLRDVYHIELINNYIYGWVSGGAKVALTAPSPIQNEAILHAVANVFEHGSQSLRRPAINLSSRAFVYLHSNIDSIYRVNPDADEFDIAHRKNVQLNSEFIGYKNAPMFTPSGISVINAKNVKTRVLNNSGTSSNPHPIDLKLIENIKRDIATPVDSVQQAGGFGENPAGKVVQDSDDDGIPDWFERERGFDINLKDANKDRDANGYTNIEEYINSFFEPVNNSEASH